MKCIYLGCKEKADFIVGKHRQPLCSWHTSYVKRHFAYVMVRRIKREKEVANG